MTYNYEVQKRHRLKKQNSLPKHLCACGCGELITSKTVNGKPRKYKHGHQDKERYKFEIIDCNGYILIYKPKYRPWRKNNYYQKHRYIYEEYYKICLLKWTEIDHINGNKLDNRIENLQALSYKQHREKHDKERKELRSKRICLICKITNIETRWAKHLYGWICRKCKHKRDGWA